MRAAWPEERPRTLAELSRDMTAALRMPGYQMAVAPPIRTRIDMLATGVRTPVGVKVFGDDLDEIERVSIALERLSRHVQYEFLEQMYDRLRYVIPLTLLLVVALVFAGSVWLLCAAGRKPRRGSCRRRYLPDMCAKGASGRPTT